MNILLDDSPFVRVYLDDILVMEKTFELQNENLAHVLKILKNYNILTKNIEKSSFLKTEVTYS